jgi:hypothetical protein
MFTRRRSTIREEHRIDSGCHDIAHRYPRTPGQPVRFLVGVLGLFQPCAIFPVNHRHRTAWLVGVIGSRV